MAERALRGTRLGAFSMESEENVVPSERQITTYICSNGHKIELPFSVEAEIPPTWSAAAARTHCSRVARPLSSSRSSRPAPTGTCCSSADPSPSSRNSSRSASSCCAPRAGSSPSAAAPDLLDHVPLDGGPGPGLIS